LHPEPESLPPASESNRSRQARSRLNITHPIRWSDDALEKTYNRKRNVDKTKRNVELRRLHG